MCWKVWLYEMPSFMSILGAMLCKINLLFANVPYCAAIYPVAVEMEHIVCQMRVKPGRHVNLNSAMQARNLPNWKIISDLGLRGARLSLDVMGFYSHLEAELIWCSPTLGQEENPLLFLKSMLLRQCRYTQCCLSKCEGDEMEAHNDNCRFYFTTVHLVK